MKKTVIGTLRFSFLAILLTFALFSCGQLSIGGTETSDISLVLVLPDYYNHVYSQDTPTAATPVSGSEMGAKVIDPATVSITVTVSASNMTTITQTLTISDAVQQESGILLISCFLESVPAGEQRVFSVVTKDGVGTTLTSGSTTADVYAVGSNVVRVPLIPSSATSLSANQTASGTVGYGKMVYYLLTVSSSGALTIDLTSTSQDVDLYVFRGDGSFYPTVFWKQGTPTDESAEITLEAAAEFYLGVFGNTSGVSNSYSLATSFVSDDSAGLTLMGGTMQGNDLGLDATTADVTTYAGTGTAGAVNGTGTAAQFNYPDGITTDGTNLYVAEYGNHTIRKIVIATGEVTTLAGQAGVSGTANGTGTAAQFYQPEGITTDGTNLYVADTGNHTIRKIVIATGVVTTLAGQAGTPGSADGTGTAAQFNFPYGITTDNTYLYVADSYNYTVRRVDPSTGVVTTIAGQTGIVGSNDGTGTAALFSYTHEITTDGTNLYILDGGNFTIRKMVIATREVTTLAGTAGSSGAVDGTGSAARFSYCYGITTDGTNLYVADSGNNLIRKIVIATKEVTTLAGSGTTGTTDGTGTAAQFDSSFGIITDGASLFVADSSNYLIRQIQ